MKTNLPTAPAVKPEFSLPGVTLAAKYPGMYCPRCNSKEIGLKMFYKGDAIWECRDCRVDFKLIFPNQIRF